MSLAIAVQMRSRIESQVETSGTALQAWAETYERIPRVVLGYQRPASAEDWPFVSLVPVRAQVDMKRQRGESASIALVCGYLLDTVERGDADGLLAVDALADAVLAAVGRPWRPCWNNLWLDAQTAERVDAQFSHPNYELELRVDFRPGAI